MNTIDIDLNDEMFDHLTEKEQTTMFYDFDINYGVNINFINNKKEIEETRYYNIYDNLAKFNLRKPKINKLTRDQQMDFCSKHNVKNLCSYSTKEIAMIFYQLRQFDEYIIMSFLVKLLEDLPKNKTYIFSSIIPFFKTEIKTIYKSL